MTTRAPFPHSLTAFQKRCLSRLGPTRIPFETVKGEEELYLVGKPTRDGDHLEIFLYEDEVGAFLNGEWNIWERIDYPVEEELIDAFLEFLSKYVAG